MDNDPELPPEGDQLSSDEETVKGDQDNEHIAEMLEEERLSSATPVPIGNTSVGNRYRDLLEAQADTPSEDGSIDSLPRRAGSPVGSLLSVTDDAISVQVCVGGTN